MKEVRQLNPTIATKMLFKGLPYEEAMDHYFGDADLSSPPGLDLMLSLRFVCGVDGFETSLRRVDAAIGFMNELKDKMTGFLQEKDALLLGKTESSAWHLRRPSHRNLGFS